MAFTNEYLAKVYEKVVAGLPRKMKVTIEFCNWVFAKFLCVRLNFCRCGFAKISKCVHTTIGTSGYPKGENLLWHTILRHAKSSVLYPISAGLRKVGD